MSTTPTTRRARRRLVAGATVLAGVALSAPAVLRADGGAAHAGGTIIDGTGTEIGVVRIVEDGTGGVHVNVKVHGLTPGAHGIHLHAVGVCTAPGFTDALGHHNPLGAQHGAVPGGPHAGDLPNLVVNEDGRGTLNAHLDGFTLTPGATSLFDANGTAIVIHANPDDFTTQPTGNSGGRVACGVITTG